jgi:hypothetical protein
MKRAANVVASLAMLSCIAGCASGGGGSDSVRVESRPIQRPSETAELRCALFLPICAWYEPGAEEPSSEAGFYWASSVAGARPARFESWSELPANKAAEFDAIGQELSYSQTATGTVSGTLVVSAAKPQSLSTPPRYDEKRELVGQSVSRTSDGIDVTAGRMVANPYAQGWNYQSFGVWNTQTMSGGAIASSSFGAATPASAVPSSGTASFVGKLGGIYVSPAGEASMASADVRVSADFGNRSLSFASQGTRLTRDLKGSTAAPQLNLGGTLTYSPATNTFSGTLTNAGGTMSGSSTGRYYGPAAQELGGVFTIKSANTAETLTGAYGGRR